MKGAVRSLESGRKGKGEGIISRGSRESGEVAVKECCGEGRKLALGRPAMSNTYGLAGITLYQSNDSTYILGPVGQD